ncbi:Rrf2 family transcriptional regulator [Larkinella humicola]|uniref:Rrf2 family transcriptional regulator n=1 Tax=Larkinella humicola TaxID=2607654 RepID=A0A5N1JEV4_9BACT|nr:Rrf2 family transcriptional regulator [Larkinella humicola]KAA9349259.1 Rrf2 family transcriptional regulator [Larkinella humicola]
MNNSRFSIAIHIMTLLARANGELLSSDFLAGSVNINPVLVRKEVSNLRKKGFIISKEGKNGGSILAKPADKILLSAIYEAVRQSPLLGQTRNSPNPDCPVGRQINTHLDTLFLDAEKALIARLDQTTLSDFTNQFD